MTRSHWAATWTADAATTAATKPKHRRSRCPRLRRQGSPAAMAVAKTATNTNAEKTVEVLSSTWRVRGELIDSISE